MNIKKINKIARISIIISIFLPMLSFPFSRGYVPRLGMVGSIQHDMEVEIYRNKGHSVEKPCLSDAERENIHPRPIFRLGDCENTSTYIRYEGGYDVSIPFKYILLFSGLILFTSMVILVSQDRSPKHV